MRLIRIPQNSFDPKINLAVEEFIVRNPNDENDYLFVYMNNSSVIIGKNQNPFEEINLSYIIKKHIPLYRRISGGGAVYHDPGNINFCYITNNTRSNFNTYTNFLKPIVEYLYSLGINASINKRNDLVIGDKKISGNAQFTSRNRMFSHGTLLFNADKTKIDKTLSVKQSRIKSKSTKSIRSKVTNIKDHLQKDISPDHFTNELILYITDYFSSEGYFDLNDNQWHEINKLANDKYASWDWIWGRTPRFQITVTFNGFTKSKVNLYIKDGLIDNVEPQIADTFTNSLKKLVGVRYAKRDIHDLILNTHSKEEQKLIADCIFPF